MTGAPASTRSDFPYYAGRPVALTPWGCSAMITACAMGFAALLAAPHVVAGQLGEWVGAVLFALLPLLGLRLATGQAWTAGFRRPTAREVWLGLVFAPLTFLARALIAVILAQGGLTADNPIGAVLAEASAADLGLDFARTGVQLMGEELVTLLPFLVLLTLLHAAGVSRRMAILITWIATALVFGALHLPTYQWHWGQSLLVICVARLVLTTPFLLTKTIWPSYIAHLANDWGLFALTLCCRD